MIFPFGIALLLKIHIYKLFSCFKLAACDILLILSQFKYLWTMGRFNQVEERFVFIDIL